MSFTWFRRVVSTHLDEPLENMYNLSYLRPLANQLQSLSFRSFFEEFLKDEPLLTKLNYSVIDFDSLGYKDSKKPIHVLDQRIDH